MIKQIWPNSSNSFPYAYQELHSKNFSQKAMSHQAKSPTRTESFWFLPLHVMFSVSVLRVYMQLYISTVLG